MKGTLLVASLYAGGFDGDNSHYSNHALVTCDIPNLTLQQWVKRLKLESHILLDMPNLRGEKLISVRAAKLVDGLIVEEVCSF